MTSLSLHLASSLLLVGLMQLATLPQVYNIRWKVEEFHRELKQLTGVESCQCRKGRIQRNHIACAITSCSPEQALFEKVDRKTRR
jgi:hypothetical protein